jgi:hypothetical protein
VKTLRVELAQPVPESVRAEVQAGLAYVSEHLLGLRIDAGGSSVELDLRDDADGAGVEADVRQLVAAMCRGLRRVDPGELWSARRSIPVRDVWAEAASRGMVFENGAGLVSLGGVAVNVLEGLRAKVARLAAEFSAEPRQFPGLISVETLARCHYFSSFPHHVTFAPHVRENLVDITDLSRNVQGEIGQYLASPTHVLSPAICFHAYQQVADQRLSRPLTLTATGRCVRYESINLSRLERSWEFSMQEIIFIGDKAWVERSRQRALERVCEWLSGWGLSAWLELATDPFFMTNFAAKRYHQLLNRAKFELRLDLGDRSLAAASFNIHGDFFGQSFGIRAEGGEWADTGCVAFGLERFVWALVTQLGAIVSDWPAEIRKDLGLVGLD